VLAYFSRQPTGYAHENISPILESQNHGMVRVGRNLTDHLVPTLLP